MSTTFGYTIFYVDDVESTLTFFQNGFGMERRFITPEGDYGELETGAATLAFVANELASSNLDGAGGFTPLDPAKPPVGASITLLTSDVAAGFEQAVTAGAEAYTQPVDKPWGQTVAYLRGPNGMLIELATPVASD